MSNKTLTAKMQLFASEFLIDGNATEAAIRAGYSSKRAAQQGYRLMQDERVLTAIKAGQAAIAKRNELTIDDILEELEEARKIAKEEGKGAPMVAASMGKAKLLGLIVDKAETKTEGNISIDISFK